MANVTCPHCGKKSKIQADMSTCPFCLGELQDELGTAIESADIAASVDTSVPDATIKYDPNQADEQLALTDSSKTAMAAELGYAELPSFMKTLDKSKTTPILKSASTGRSGSIPSRTIGDEQSGDEIRDYRLEKEIGAGSFGTVYRAMQVPLDRHVALKLLKPLPLPVSTEGDKSKVAREQAENKVREEFLREAQFTGKLEHPNIVPIHDIGIVSGGKQSDRPFYVMKEIKGIQWQDVIKEKTRDENVDIFQRVIDAVGFSHSRNILHCDLKPENVMLGEFGEVLVVDWGQAIDTTDPESFRPGGTPSYCSPEMAQYWCDFGSEPKKAERSKKELSSAADVYLLGAILFQIVTGRPPHFGLKGESAADVMARAARNEIRRYDNFAKDELLQIALRALRHSDQAAIKTVSELNSELKSYEDRKQSIDLRDRAFDLLESARASKNYDNYQKAKFGFEESLELWNENPTARDGLQQTRLNCAELALDDQNFDLGLGMLNETDTQAEVKVKEKLQLGKKRRDRRKRLVFVLGIGFATAVVAGLVTTAYLGKVAADKTETARAATDALDIKIVELEKVTKENEASIALASTAQADAAAAEAAKIVAEMDAAEAGQKAAEAEGKVVEAGRKVIEAEAKLADADVKIADAEVKVADFDMKVMKAEMAVQAAETQEAVARQAARAAEEASRLLLYKTQITTITQKANAKDYNGTGKLLAAIPDNNKNTFEWRRLNLLAHPEVTSGSRFPKERLMGAQLSGDRETLALCFDDRIEICAANEPNKILHTINMTGVESIVLSHDGKQLAIGRSGGQIQIVDSANGRELLEQPLTAQTVKITDMEFTKDGRRLLSVGIPDRINSSALGIERPLMLWQANGDRWDPMPAAKFLGAMPRLSEATFSADGNRIVTSNPDSRADEQVAFVLGLSGDTYTWIGPDDVNETVRRRTKSGFVTSIFADPAGNQVISSFVSKNSANENLNQIVVWNVMESENTVPISFQANTGASQSQDSLYPQFKSDQTIVLNDVVKYLDFSGEILLATQNKRMIYWKLPDGDLAGLQQEPKTYAGHGRDIKVSQILNAGSKFITIATGAEPEILLTNTKTIREESQPLRLTRTKANDDDGSPFSFFSDREADRVIVGNDEGLVSVNAVTDGSFSDTPLLKWQTSAWEKHLVTREHLFGLSKRDDLYRYNLESGELETILTKLSEVKSEDTKDDEANRILMLEISADSRFAVLQRQNNKAEFEIWNLQKQTRTVVPFGDKQGLNETDILPLLTISEDGQWIAGGRVRFYVWRNDGTVVGDAGTENSAKETLNCLKFFGGSSKLAAGRKGLLRTYDVEPQLALTNAYPISILSDNVGKPNVVAAQIIEGKSYVVLETIPGNKQNPRNSGLALFELQNDRQFTEIVTIERAQHATLTSVGKLFAVRLDEKLPLVKYDLQTGQEPQYLPLVVSPREVAGVSTESRNIFSRVYTTPNGELVLQWDTNNRQNSVTVTADGSLSKLSVIATPTVRAVGLSQNRAATFENGKVRFWNLDFEKSTVTAAGSLAENVDLFALSPTGTTAFAVLENNQKMGLVDIATGKLSTELDAELPSRITAVGWSVDATKLAFGFENGSAGIWQDNAFTPINVTSVNKAIDQIQFSGDGESIVIVQRPDEKNATENTGLEAFVLRKQSIDEGHEDANIGAGHSQPWITVRLAYSDGDAIRAADISTDGKRVVTGSQGGRVTIWNAESQAGSVKDSDSSERELLNLDRFDSEVRTVRFDKNETNVVAFETESSDHEGRIYPTAR